MKVLKYLGIVLLAIIILLLIVALFVPEELVYEKSISINAPIEQVWENVNSLGDLDKWNLWDEKDPLMVKQFFGTDGTVGAMQRWESDVKELGKGSQTITNIAEPFLFETDLIFYTPYESQADAYIKLMAEGDGTKATWGFQSVMPYPYNVMTLFMNMEKSMGEDWSKGLHKLKVICETPMETPVETTDNEVIE